MRSGGRWKMWRRRSRPSSRPSCKRSATKPSHTGGSASTPLPLGERGRVYAYSPPHPQPLSPGGERGGRRSPLTPNPSPPEGRGEEEASSPRCLSPRKGASAASTYLGHERGHLQVRQAIEEV